MPPSFLEAVANSALTAVLLSVAAITFGTWDVPLPYPATTHRIQELPTDKIPGPPRALQGPLEPNTLLRDRAVLLFNGSVHGSESVIPGPGPTSVTMIDRYGYVWIADAAEAATDEAESADGADGHARPSSYSLRPQPTAYIGPGRPLGFHYDAGGNLIVCNSLTGLVMLEAGTGKLVSLASRVSRTSFHEPDSLITYANDLDLAADGTIYFTDCQNITTALNQLGHYDTFWSFLLGLYSGTPSGRLLSYEPTTGSTHVVATGFWYANGVAISADGSFVAVVETNSFRVMRVWLTGPKAGTTDTLVDGLPAFPDGISRASDGGFWLALVAPRSALVPLLRFKLVRSVLPWLPAALRPKVGLQGLVVKLSPEGEIESSLWDPSGDRVASVSAVEEHGGRLWLGNLRGSGVSYYDV